MDATNNPKPIDQSHLLTSYEHSTDALAVFNITTPIEFTPERRNAHLVEAGNALIDLFWKAQERHDLDTLHCGYSFHGLIDIHLIERRTGTDGEPLARYQIATHFRMTESSPLHANKLLHKLHGILLDAQSNGDERLAGTTITGCGLAKPRPQRTPLASPENSHLGVVHT
ncbi:MAG: hypothetical protein AWU57_562 [Marinobacter sp. T13-3]|nr:MAG: hypothetical protein AWU57_562 [Marinobacter sp. T13-3]